MGGVIIIIGIIAVLIRVSIRTVIIITVLIGYAGIIGLCVISYCYHGGYAGKKDHHRVDGGNVQKRLNPLF